MRPLQPVPDVCSLCFSHRLFKSSFLTCHHPVGQNAVSPGLSVSTLPEIITGSPNPSCPGSSCHRQHMLGEERRRGEPQPHRILGLTCKPCTYRLRCVPELLAEASIITEDVQEPMLSVCVHAVMESESTLGEQCALLMLLPGYGARQQGFLQSWYEHAKQRQECLLPLAPCGICWVLLRVCC